MVVAVKKKGDPMGRPLALLLIRENPRESVARNF
jgi:hypothetical protein